MSRKNVEHTHCPECRLRLFGTRPIAIKALGKAQSYRNRRADQHGTRRGLLREHRVFPCPSGPGFHMTAQNRKDVRA